MNGFLRGNTSKILFDTVSNCNSRLVCRSSFTRYPEVLTEKKRKKMGGNRNTDFGQINKNCKDTVSFS